MVNIFNQGAGYTWKFHRIITDTMNTGDKIVQNMETGNPITNESK